MRIELLYSEGCPYAEGAENNLREVLFEEELQQQVERIHITSQEHAVEQKFPGSPTIRINGRDIEPHAERHTEYGVRCRLYASCCGTMVNWPPKDMIRRALRDAMHAS